MQRKADEYLEFAYENKLYDILEKSKSKHAYKVLEPVFSVLLTKTNYIPSRINRGILEIVGRTLRSLKTRKDVFELLNSLADDPKQWNGKLLKKHGVFANLEYVKNIKQQVVNYKRKHGKLPLDFYQLQKPAKLKTQILTYAPDDGQAIQMESLENQIQLKLKLLTKDDKWMWRKTTITLPSFLQNKQIAAPDIRVDCIHGHWLPVLDFKITLAKPPKIDSNRFLTVDWGINKLVTCCVFDYNGTQLSQPIFQHFRPIQRKLANIRKDIDRIKHHRDLLKTQCSLFQKYNREIAKRWRKISAINQELSHLTANVLVFIAQMYGCRSIYCELLKSLKSRDKSKKLNYLINSTVRQSIYSKVEYKAALSGIKLQKPVNPAGTSSTCPKCSHKGVHVRASDRNTRKRASLPWFYCLKCKFNADRDYVATLNIARKVIYKKNLKHLSQKAIVYKKIGLPDKLFCQDAFATRKSCCCFLKGWNASVFLSAKNVRNCFNSFQGTIFGALRT